MLTGVPTKYVSDVWERIAPRLQRIIDKTHDRRFAVEDLHNALLSGDMQLWFWNDWEVIFLTQINVWPRAKEFNIGWIEGTDVDWEEALGVFTKIAREAGCDFISAGGRIGWSRKTNNLWQRKFCILINDIGDYHA